MSKAKVCLYDSQNAIGILNLFYLFQIFLPAFCKSIILQQLCNNYNYCIISACIYSVFMILLYFVIGIVRSRKSQFKLLFLIFLRLIFNYNLFASFCSLKTLLYTLLNSSSSSWFLFSLIVITCIYIFISICNLLSLYNITCICFQS